MALAMSAQPLRIAIFAPHFAEYSVRLALALSHHASVLLVLDRGNCCAECDVALMRQARGALEILEFDSAGRLKRAKSLCTILFRVLLFSPPIVNVQEQVDTLSTLVARALRLFAPIALTIHDPRPHSGRDADWVAANARNRRRLREAASLFHVHGAFCAFQLREEVADRRPVLVTAHGALLAPAPDQIREPEGGRLLFFGRMETYKGLGVLLDAAKMLHQRGLRFHLALMGRGSELDGLRARLSSLDCVSCVEGFVTPDAAVAAFQHASIVLLPYIEATQSGVAAAAFANGRPVVASRCGGLTDAVRHDVDGLLVPPGDAKELAGAVESLLLNEKKLALLTEGARNSGEARCSWDRIARTLVEGFEDFLAARR